MTEPDFLVERLREQLLLELRIFFGSPADVAFSRQLRTLCDRRLGEPRERPDFRALGAEGRAPHHARARADCEAVWRTGAARGRRELKWYAPRALARAPYSH